MLKVVAVAIEDRNSRFSESSCGETPILGVSFQSKVVEHRRTYARRRTSDRISNVAPLSLQFSASKLASREG